MSTRTMPNSTTLGHVITVCQPSDGRRRELPPLTIGGLALELAEMLRSSLPAALVAIVRIDLRHADRAEAEQHTEAIKRLVIEARETEQPGHAFLVATGYWQATAGE